jgi:hypothetical protein
MTENTSTHINKDQLDVFLHRYLNLPLPSGSVSTILTEAFNAMIGAGVVVLDDGTPPDQLGFLVHGGRVMLAKGDPQSDDVAKIYWTPEGDMPKLDDAITPIAELLVAILNSPPWTGAEDWPHSRN